MSFLNLERNDIRTLQTHAFNGLSSLKTLSLKGYPSSNSSNSRIEHIEPNAFVGLNNLEYLNLANNHISELQTDTFQGLNSLKGLELRSNNIETFEAGCFGGLTNLEWLHLGEISLDEASDLARWDVEGLYVVERAKRASLRPPENENE